MRTMRPKNFNGSVYGDDIVAKPLREFIAFRFITPSDRGAEYCDERVCLCVRLSAILPRVRSSPFFVHVSCGRGSVLLWGVVIRYVFPV